MPTDTKFFPTRTAISALLCAAAISAPTATAQESDTVATTVASDMTAGPQESDGRERVVISGRRLSIAEDAIGLDQATNTVAVTRDALLSAPAGVSGLKMLEQLPGFNVQTDGALGLYEFGNSVTTRAFNLQQIGFVLDGIPMGRSDAFGGSPIFRYVDNENLGAVVASPGAGDVTQPSYASLGPIIEYQSIDPSDTAGGTASIAGGDDNLLRTFLKLETGDIGGFSAYLSRSKTDADLWRGAGYIDREHWEGKAKFEFDSDTYISFKYVANDFFDYDSPSVSRAQYEAGTPCANGEGGRYCGYAADLPDGVIGEPIDYPGETGAIGSASTDWYLDRVNIRQDALYGGTFATNIGDNFDMEVTAYYEDKDGFGVSPESYSSVRSRYLAQMAAGLPVTAPRGTAYGLSGVGGHRKGVVASGTLELANHEITVGAWTELDDYTRSQQRLNHVGGIQSGDVLYDEVNYFRRLYNSERETLQVFVKDTISLLDDRLKLDIGVKSLKIDYSLDGYRDYNDYYRTVGGTPVPGWGPQSLSETFEENFLPMVGFVYEVSPTEQVFASYSQNFALPRGADDIFSTAPSNVPTVPAPDGEESENFEVGIRTLRGNFTGAAAVYYTTFDNRLEAFSSEVPGTGGTLETYSQNVGGVEAYGLELTGAWKPDFFNDQVYFNGNFTYNHTTFQDNIPGVAPIAGNFLPDSPEYFVTAGVTWEPTSYLVANLSARYTGERYANFINTSEMESFTIVSGYVDFGEGFGIGPIDNIKTRINVDNIFDEDVLAFVFTSVTGDGFFRPQSPRTVSISFTVDF